MKKAFYAGCFTMLTAATDACESMPERKAERQLKMWDVELRAFAASLLADAN